MRAYDLIDRKKRGGRHSGEEIRFLVRGVTDGSIPDYQVAAWLMAVWHKGLTAEETTALTLAMRDSGEVLDLSSIPGPTADKHSTGGVGDKVSLALAPLAACLGLYVPMLSGRGLGHTGGTLDKLTAIEGYRVDLQPEDMIRIVREVGCSIIGQTDRIAPADRRLYALRDVTATVDCIPLIVSSILSKKFAAGPEHLVIDLKCGSGAFMRDLESARQLAKALIDTGRSAGKKMAALITDMDQPLGETVGHALEVQEILDCLDGGGPADLRELTLELTVEMAMLAGAGEREALRIRAERALDDGSARERFERMVRAHGGDLSAGLEVAPEVEPVRALHDGWIRSIRTDEVGWAVVDLGGGRRTYDDPLDLGVGLRFQLSRGDAVQAGDPIVSIHARDEATAEVARQRLTAAIEIAGAPPEPRPLVLERHGGRQV